MSSIGEQERERQGAPDPHREGGREGSAPHRSARFVELLAPAGNELALHAAVRAGADAVYLGMTAFNARQGADNFDLEALERACCYTQLRGVKLYLTVNTLILPAELERACELIGRAYQLGVDGFIVQDLGLASEIRRRFPAAELHASTQMNIHNEADVRAAALWGAARITFARELSLGELTRLVALAHELGMESECFAHGALCLCYSGRCLLSSLVGGRSANRGRCAQACRLPYTLLGGSSRTELPAQGDYLLSPKDLACIQVLPQLIETGVDALKIEGRMKSPAYVFTVVGAYREALDRILYEGVDQDRDAETVCSSRGQLSQGSLHKLEESFSRGFTTAYLEGDSSNAMMSYRQPNNRGVFIGRVCAQKADRVELTSSRELHEGDVLGIRTNKGQAVIELQKPLLLGEGRWEVFCQTPLSKGDRVFRLRDNTLRFVDDPLLPAVAIEGRLVARRASPLTLTVATFCNEEGPRRRSDLNELKTRFEVTVEGAVVEPARTKELLHSEARDQVNKLGTSPFSFGVPPRLRIELDQGVGMGFSQLHRLRREALGRLESKIIMAARRDRHLIQAPPATPLIACPPQPPRICVIATNPSCARAARKAGADAIYVPLIYAKRGEALMAGQLSETVEQAGYPKQWTPMLPTIAHDAFERGSKERDSYEFSDRLRPGKRVWAETLGQVLEAKNRGALPEVSPGMGIMNPAALRFVVQCGARRIWLSPELALGQIRQLLDPKPISAGIVVCGAAELMVTEHCLLMSEGPCNRDCAHCSRRKSPHYLKDRKGYEMPVLTDRFGRSHLYNAVSLDLTHLIPDLLAVGVDAFMVDSTLMNVEETIEATRRVTRALALAQSQAKALPKVKDRTTGHIFRGVASV